MTTKLKTLVYDLERVKREFSELDIKKKKGVPFMAEGPLKIFDSNGCYRGFYEVQILIPIANYPHGFPSLKEISNKIPRKIDRHIYESTGTCCVTILQKQIIEAKRGITIYDYIHKYVLPYFANQIYFDENKVWANGEYMHGGKGILQYYMELFKTTNINIVIDGLKAVLNDQKIGRNDPCFCGSPKFKKCHYFAVEELQWLGDDQLSEDVALILKAKRLKANEQYHSKNA